MDWFLYDGDLRHERVKGLIFVANLDLCRTKNIAYCKQTPSELKLYTIQ